MSAGRWRLLLAAWIVTLAATLGALFIGEVMGKAPCLLCWYQRIAMFPLALILGVGCLRSDPNALAYALPFVAAGLLLAAWHSLVYAGIMPQEAQPCARSGPSCSGDAMRLGSIPIPFLSLAAFAAIGALLAAAGRAHT